MWAADALVKIRWRHTESPQILPAEEIPRANIRAPPGRRRRTVDERLEGMLLRRYAMRMWNMRQMFREGRHATERMRAGMVANVDAGRGCLPELCRWGNGIQLGVRICVGESGSHAKIESRANLGVGWIQDFHYKQQKCAIVFVRGASIRYKIPESKPPSIIDKNQHIDGENNGFKLWLGYSQI